MPLRTLHAGEGCQRVLACERSHEGFSCESGGGHACRERLPQAVLRSSHRRWAARHSLSGCTQGATARHATTPTPALLLHRAAGAPLGQIHSGSDYRSRVTPQYLPIRASTPGKYKNNRSKSACTLNARKRLNNQAVWPVIFDITGPICACALKTKIPLTLGSRGHHDWPVMSATRRCDPHETTDSELIIDREPPAS